MRQLPDNIAYALMNAVVTHGKDKASRPLRDALNVFKEKLNAVFGRGNDLVDVINRLERKPDSEGVKKQLKEELAEYDITAHPELEVALRALLKTGDNIDLHAEGDVAFAKDQAVALIIKNLTVRPDSDPPGALMRQYLQRIAAESNYLPWVNVDDNYSDPKRGENLMLVDIYTPLDTTAIEKPDSEEVIRRHLSDDKGTRRISAQKMVDTNSRLILLGDPGSGKSTFINYLTYIIARADLTDTESWLETLKKNGPWSHGAMLPVRIVLKDFAANLPDDVKSGSAGLLFEFLETSTVPSGFYNALRKILLDEQVQIACLIMLDGLDEVPEARRQIVVQAIDAFAAQLHWHRYIVTCRVYAYVGHDVQLSGFQPVTLMPFSQDQIEDFIDAWYRALRMKGRYSERDAAKRSETLLEAATRPDLIGLAERPLLMTVMALLHSFRGELPNDRVELYQWTVDLLLRRWESRHVGEKGILESLDVPGLKMTDLEAGFHAVAFDIHAGSGADDGVGEIREGDLRERLAPFLNDSWDKAGEFVKYVHDRAGLLIRHKKAAYTFPHRTFQEFLAACHLVGMKEYPTQSARLLCENPDRWRIVYILAAGYAARTHRLSAAIGSIDALFSHCKDKEVCNERPMDHLAAIAGEALLEIGLVGVRREPTGKRRLEEVRQWLLAAMANDAHLQARDRVAAGNVLSRLGDPRFSPEQYFLPDDDNLGFVDIPAGPFQMGSDKQTDPSADDGKLHRHTVVLSEYRIARYPVTVAQYRKFATETGRALDRDWLAENQYDNHPVVEVTWHDAMAYCEWLTAKPFVGGTITLPTEAQWEKAARGDDGRIFPWGDKPDPEKANYEETRIGVTSPVGCFPAGKSPYEIFDLSGNVWEWCQDYWHGNYNGAPVDGRAWEDQAEGTNRVLRGGAWSIPAEYCRAANRGRGDPGDRHRIFGFRLVCLPGQPGEPGK